MSNTVRNLVQAAKSHSQPHITQEGAPVSSPMYLVLTSCASTLERSGSTKNGTQSGPNSGSALTRSFKYQAKTCVTTVSNEARPANPRHSRSYLHQVHGFPDVRNTERGDEVLSGDLSWQRRRDEWQHAVDHVLLLRVCDTVVREERAHVTRVDPTQALDVHHGAGFVDVLQ